jgi:hypothetical protein
VTEIEQVARERGGGGAIVEADAGVSAAPSPLREAAARSPAASCSVRVIATAAIRYTSIKEGTESQPP